jgi:2-polyprenyl-3-methyl-5-hydroxy-6-metoxy-1,4-benzoquinol methylase
MIYDQIPSKMSALNRDDADAIIWSSHESRKTMAMVFFGVNGRGFVKILPEGTKLTSEYFKDQVLQEISQGSPGS